MRLTFFSTYYHPYTSGLTTYPKHLFQKLAKNHQITALTFNHQKNTRQVQSGNPKIIRLSYNLRISKGFLSKSALREFPKVLDHTDLLIVNLPNVHAVPLVWQAKKRGIKSLGIIHCLPKLPKTPKNILVQPILDTAVNLQLRWLDHLTTYTKDYASNQSRIDKHNHKLSLITPPIPRAKPDPQFLNELVSQKSDHKWIGFVGRIASEKGLENLIKAIALLKNPKTTLVLIGPRPDQVIGEKATSNKIMSLIKKHQLNPQIIPKLSGNKLAAAYKALDVLILPSINQTEAFGMVQVEAMRQGTPVISTDLPGVRQPIAHTGMGITIPINDSKALANAITTILHTPSTFAAKHMITKANSYCLPKNTAQEYEKIISELTRE